MHINRQIGNYYITSQEQNVAPFCVSYAAPTNEPISRHQTVTEAVKALLRYREADKRRRG